MRKNYSDEEIIANLQLRDDYLFNAVFSDKDEFKTNKTVEYITEHVASTNEQLKSFVHYIYINASVNDGSKIAHLMTKFNDSSTYNEEFTHITETTNRIKYTEGGIDYMKKTMFQEFKEQLIEDSIAEGRSQGRTQSIIEFYEDGSFTAEQAASKLGVSVDEFLTKYIQ